MKGIFEEPRPRIRFTRKLSDKNAVSVLMVRHGESTWNANHIWQGQSDPKLSEKGVRQAESLADSLKEEKIDLVFCSDLTRAVETADIICRTLDLGTPIKDKRLRERAFSSLEGKSVSQISRLLGKKIDSTFLLDNDVLPYSETLNAFDRRVFDFFTELSNKYMENSILIVAHGGVLRTVIRNYAPEKLTSRALDNACIIHFFVS